MSLWIKETRGMIIKLENKEKYKTCTFISSEKNQSGEWENQFWNCKIVGSALNKITEEKQKITITKSKVTNKTYKDKEDKSKTWLELIIFDIEGEEESLF